MVSWIKDLIAVFNSPKETFYKAVYILDRYFDKSSESLKICDLHEIGVTCVFIASKYIERDPLTLEIMSKSASHGKVSKSQIKKREMKIMNTLKFKISTPDLKECVDAYLGSLQVNSSTIRYFEDDIKQHCEKLMAVACHNYRFSFSMKPS